MFTHEHLLELNFVVTDEGNILACSKVDVLGCTPILYPVLFYNSLLDKNFANLFGSSLLLYKSCSKAKELLENMAQMANDQKNFNVAEILIEQAAALDLTLLITREGIREITNRKVTKGEKDS